MGSFVESNRVVKDLFEQLFTLDPFGRSVDIDSKINKYLTSVSSPSKVRTMKIQDNRVLIGKLVAPNTKGYFPVNKVQLADSPAKKKIRFDEKKKIIR